ncbi:signal peptide peptidase SppA [Myxococcota bacterium]|nr:signal peptide peptidase SppA [Myxococcota bacterium]
MHTPVKSVKPATAKTVKADPAQKELAFIELSGKVVDRVSPSPFGQNKALPLSKVLRAIKKLGELKNADTLLIQISDFKASLETVWEIRNLLISIGKNEKKRIVVYADSYDLTSYLLGSAAHRIILNPAGEWSVTGLAMESMFMKDFLGSLGITADFLQMGKYKGAAENLTRTSMSPELKESLGRLLDSLYQSFTTILATSRKIKEVDIKALIDKAPLTAQDAVAAHLVDDIQPFHLVFEQYSKGKKIRKPKKKEAKKVSFLSLLSPPKTSTEVDVPHVALILADGSIMYGSEDPNDLFSGDSTIYSKSLVKAINKAADNEKAKAVVLRINSPGGSALASEKIWQALHRCATKKPLIVSMGSYAASGGYYIAAAAHEVFASPFTITGSIGVVGGKMVLGGTLGKLKIRTEILKRGNNAAWMSTSSVFSETERAAIKRTMENVYRLFKDRVRQGRKKVKDVESLAQGRIWSGADAHGNHLVDTMGGLLDATHRARILGKLKGDDPVMIYPRPKPFMAAISEFFDKGTPLDEVSLSLFGNFLPQIHSLLVYKKLLKRERVLLTLPFVLRELY